MLIEHASVDVFEDIEDPAVALDILKKIELIGRTCYKGTDKITEDSCRQFVRGIVARQHEAMLEHVSLTVRFIVDRGVSHEIVRHRLASFAQESTRYCNYTQGKFGNQITVIQPCYLRIGTPEWTAWYDSCMTAEKAYFEMIKAKRKPEEARAVLPNSLKTELWMTANIRELRHFLKLRAVGTTGKPHPQMEEVAKQLMDKLVACLPELFDDFDWKAIG